ncbi:MAG TPA: sugar porter family MFS transporter [Acidobacteriaceae bacterium]|nr:sugar porter family MFS transporter [Acidobacteriaceae bacterium]
MITPRPLLPAISTQQTPTQRAFQWKVASIAGLGGILYGYDIGIIAAALLYVRNEFALSAHMEGLVVSSVLIGSMLGAIVGGAFADKYGRRSVLLAGAIVFLAGSLAAFLAPSVAWLIVARFVLGLAIGFTSVTAPVYVSELSPPQSRGMRIGLYQFALTLGIALANLTGYLLAAQHAWRAMFGLGAAPAILFLLLLLTVPESPRWLIANGQTAKAETILQRALSPDQLSTLLAEIKSSLRQSTERRWSALFAPTVRRGLIIAVGFTILQQVTGINTVFYYGPQIFALAGVASDKSAIFTTFLLAITNVVATVISLTLVDRLGRKPLLYTGVSGMLLSLAVLAWCFHSQSTSSPALAIAATICLLVYVISFAFSMGPIGWILVAEVFPLRLRARGVAAATLGSGASNSLVAYTFLPLIGIAGNSGVFSIYAAFCIVTLLFTYFLIPETTGRELESISSEAIAPIAH